MRAMKATLYKIVLTNVFPGTSETEGYRWQLSNWDYTITGNVLYHDRKSGLASLNYFIKNNDIVVRNFKELEYRNPEFLV